MLYLSAIVIIEIIAIIASAKSIINFYNIDKYKDFALFHLFPPCGRRPLP